MARSSRELVKMLRRKQAKHRVLLAKLEKTTARLERRTANLHALEAAIAAIERRLVGPGGASNGAPNGAKPLRRACVIFNPTAGPDTDSAQRIAEIVTHLRTHGIDANVEIKTSGKMGRARAKAAVDSGAELIIAVGGDGTVEDVAAQMVGSASVLGIVATGTSNNLARSLGVPLEVAEACALIGMGTVRHIDVGRVQSADRAEVEYFLEGAGVGLTAVAALTGEAVHKGRWNLVPRGLRKMFASKPGIMRVHLDDVVVEASSRMVTVSNSPLMGRNFVVAPKAKMDDGMFDVILYDGMGEAEIVGHFMAAAKGAADELRTYRARQVRIQVNAPMLINSDADVGAQRRAIEIEILPKALAVIVGNGIGLTVPVASAPVPPPLTGDPEKLEFPDQTTAAEPVPTRRLRERRTS